MTVKEMYENIGGNYQEALGRLMKDALIQRFALKFLQDPSFNELMQAIEAGDTEAAFRAAHTLKGVAKNMAFTKLADGASAMTEHLRGGNFAEAAQMMSSLKADYELTIGEIQKLG